MTGNSKYEKSPQKPKTWHPSLQTNYRSNLKRIIFSFQLREREALRQLPPQPQQLRSQKLWPRRQLQAVMAVHQPHRGHHLIKKIPT